MTMRVQIFHMKRAPCCPDFGSMLLGIINRFISTSRTCHFFQTLLSIACASTYYVPITTFFSTIFAPELLSLYSLCWRYVLLVEVLLISHIWSLSSPFMDTCRDSVNNGLTLLQIRWRLFSCPRSRRRSHNPSQEHRGAVLTTRICCYWWRY